MPKSSPVSTMTLTEIAELVGVHRSAVVNWRERYPDFPRLVANADGGSTGYDRVAVKAWLRARRPDLVVRPNLEIGRDFHDKVNFIWAVADLLRGDYKP